MDVVITAARGQGKTTELIRYAAAGQLTIVTANGALVREVIRMARAMGEDIRHPVTWDGMARGYGHGYFSGGLAVDDLDLCVQQMTRIPVRAATLNVTPPR